MLTADTDPDFQEHTRKLLADISAARGYPVEFTTELLPTPTETVTAPTPISYPFNLLLTTATIPSSLASYLDTRHPSLTRLASPNLHHLPKSLKTEYENWTGGNKDADIERRIRRVWGEDSIGPDFNGVKSKVLIFCNRSTKVESLGRFLKERGIPNVALTSSGEERKRGSNRHLDGFLRTRTTGDKDTQSIAPATSSPEAQATPSSEEAFVMITTSLLSRGLDFSPEIKHVFIVDEPRNMIDFLHRAGRSGRAGQAGKVVVFGKMKGRGSERARDVRTKVGALRA
jgi:ATP-dependent RNA helicase MRH4